MRMNTYKDRPKNRLGLKGVYHMPHLQAKPYKAYARHHSQYVCIGYFQTAQEAARAYNLWAMPKFGPEAYFNPIRP